MFKLRKTITSLKIKPHDQAIDKKINIRNHWRFKRKIRSIVIMNDQEKICHHMPLIERAGLFFGGQD